MLYDKYKLPDEEWFARDKAEMGKTAGRLLQDGSNSARRSWWLSPRFHLVPEAGASSECPCFNDTAAIPQRI